MNETEKLVAAVETAAILLSSPESTVDMLFMLAEARQHIQELTARNAELLDNSNRPLIDAEREAYNRTLASREQEITDVRNVLDAVADERDLWKKRANELADSMKAQVMPLLVGDPLVFAARAYQKPANGEAAHKINAIKELRNLTSLGLAESKLAVEQIIKIMEMKEAVA